LLGVGGIEHIGKLLLMVSPDSLDTACPLSAETPLIVLCSFPEPALAIIIDAAARLSGAAKGGVSALRIQGQQRIDFLI
jgi:hypothetical protein